MRALRQRHAAAVALFLIALLQPHTEYLQHVRAASESAQCDAGGSGTTSLAQHATLGFSYEHVLAPARDVGILFSDIPGFTRSVLRPTHALIAPESRVFSPWRGWDNTLISHIITPAIGAHFTMFIANMAANSTAGPPSAAAERFVFVLQGAVQIVGGKTLQTDDFAYFPPKDAHRLISAEGAGLIVLERKYALKGTPPRSLSGSTGSQPVLPAAGEIFVLRKLLPQTPEFDFNMHVMDFRPGETLNVKEMHYNQHGLILLAGQGIYRLNEEWFPVQAGDAIWMAPFVPQWYGALGATSSRYLLYKDTTVDPLDSS